MQDARVGHIKWAQRRQSADLHLKDFYLSDDLTCFRSRWNRIEQNRLLVLWASAGQDRGWENHECKNGARGRTGSGGVPAADATYVTDALDHK